MKRKYQYSFGLLFTTSIAPHFPLSFSPLSAEKQQSLVSPAGHMPLSGVHLIPCSAVRKFQRWIKYSIPPPSLSALPSSGFLSFLGLLFNMKSDSNIYSSMNQRRCSAWFFPPSCAQIWYFSPRHSVKAKKRHCSFPFLSMFHLKRRNAKCNNASGCMERGECLTDPLCWKHDLFGLVLTGNCVVCVVWSLFLSLPALFLFLLYSPLYAHRHTITGALRMWGSL